VAVKAILRRFGWVGNIREMRELRAAICGALDMMQGYGDTGCAK
jgi:transcriptional regulator with PAS, ATPase and Fis domain